VKTEVIIMMFFVLFGAIQECDRPTDRQNDGTDGRSVDHTALDFNSSCAGGTMATTTRHMLIRLTEA